MLRIAMDDYSRMVADGENDTADKALQVVAKQIGKIVRPSDAVGRHDGSGFAVILPGMSAGAAYSVARRIYDEVAAAGFNSPNGKRPLAVSIGVAASPIHGENPAALLDAVNQALQSARRSESNRVETAARTPPKGKAVEA
jgi:diguanylate cyclase (GGDEF)-like protein